MKYFTVLFMSFWLKYSYVDQMNFVSNYMKKTRLLEK